MQVGKKGGGKHWTKKEIEAREAAAAEMERAEPLEITPPSWLSKAALVVWREAIELAKDVKLLDKLDTQALAVYCDTVADYSFRSAKKRKTVEDRKLLQSSARIIAQYADKLGFTPSARARLVKKRAEENKDDFGEKFD